MQPSTTKPQTSFSNFNEMKQYYDDMVSTAHRAGIVPKADSAWEKYTSQVKPYVQSNDMRGVHDVLKHLKTPNQVLQSHQVAARMAGQNMETGQLNVKWEDKPTHNTRAKLNNYIEHNYIKNNASPNGTKRRYNNFRQRGMNNLYTGMKKDIDHGPMVPFVPDEEFDSMMHTHPFQEDRALLKRIANNIQKRKSFASYVPSLDGIYSQYYPKNEHLLSPEQKQTQRLDEKEFLRITRPTPNLVSPSGEIDFRAGKGADADMNVFMGIGDDHTVHQIYNPETGYQSAHIRTGNLNNPLESVYFQHRPTEQGLVPYIRDLQLNPQKSKFRQYTERLRNLDA